MRGAIILAFLFVLLAVVESSLLWVTHMPWIASLPVLMIAGFLVMQRIGLSEGVGWFIAASLLRGDVLYLFLAIIGPMLMHRIFSTRSVYALLGVGMCTYGIGIALLGILRITSGWIGLDLHWHQPLGVFLPQWILLGPGLYAGLTLVRSLERTVGSRVALKSLS